MGGRVNRATTDHSQDVVQREVREAGDMVEKMDTRDGVGMQPVHLTTTMLDANNGVRIDAGESAEKCLSPREMSYCSV